MSYLKIEKLIIPFVECIASGTKGRCFSNTKTRPALEEEYGEDGVRGEAWQRGQLTTRVLPEIATELPKLSPSAGWRVV